MGSAGRWRHAQHDRTHQQALQAVRSLRRPRLQPSPRPRISCRDRSSDEVAEAAVHPDSLDRQPRRGSPLLRMAGQALLPAAPRSRLFERPTQRARRREEVSFRDRHLGPRRDPRSTRSRRDTVFIERGRHARRSQGCDTDVRLLARRAGRPQSPDRPRSTNLLGHVQSAGGGSMSTLQRRRGNVIVNPLRARRHRPLRRPDASDRDLGRVPAQWLRSSMPSALTGRLRRSSSRPSTPTPDARAEALVAPAGDAGADSMEPCSYGSRRIIARRTAADFRQRSCRASLYDSIYAPGTRQNRLGAPGHYRFFLAHGFDASRLPAGHQSPADRGRRHARKPRRRGRRRSPRPSSQGLFESPVEMP